MMMTGFGVFGICIAVAFTFYLCFWSVSKAIKTIRNHTAHEEVKKTLGVMNVVLLSLAIYLTAFNCVVLWLFHETGNEPVTLIASVYTASVGEAGFLSAIKKEKMKSGN